MERSKGIVGELRHGILGVADALAQSVALLSLALGVAFASSAAAGEAGIAAPFAYLIAGVGSLCLGSVIIRFTRRMASAGGLYTYISRGLNPSAGFLGGWLYGGGFAVGISFVLVIGAFFMSVAFTAHTSLHWGWYPWFFIMLAALAVISLVDIRISTRVQLVLAAIGVGAIMVLALDILFEGGASGLSFAALAGTPLTARTTCAVGREGGLPRVFAWTHPRFRTPWTGIVFSLVVTLLLGVFFAHHYDPITYFIWMATCATIGILITYILMAIGGIAYFAKDRAGWNPLLDLVIPAGAIAICGYTLYKSIHPTPAYTGIVKWAPWVALIWLALGVAIDVVLTAMRPEHVRRFGSILGASDGAPEEPP